MSFTKESQTKKQPKKKRKNAKSERKVLIEQLDNEIRRVIKSRDTECFTCGKTAEDIGWYGVDNKHGLQVGHYISRGVYALRWDLINCNAQCSYCNGRHRFDHLPYTTALICKYGEDSILEFDRVRNEVKKTTTPQLRELLATLKEV
jgi:hypothetical protein